MTIEQTVEIPENHRLVFNIPPHIRAGSARVALTITELTGDRQNTAKRSMAPLMAMRGSCKGEDTLEAYFGRKRADKKRESELDKKSRGIIG
jgi:hypothetical protein